MRADKKAGKRSASYAALSAILYETFAGKKSRFPWNLLAAEKMNLHSAVGVDARPLRICNLRREGGAGHIRRVMSTPPEAVC